MRTARPLGVTCARGSRRPTPTWSRGLGTVGYVLRDRSSGARYANANAGAMIWTASTIKLAMVVDLLTRERAGALRLSGDDRQLMVNMLRNSDNDAADSLWTRYGGPDHKAFNAGFPRYGMTDLRPQPGFGDMFPYWGFLKSSSNDLERADELHTDTTQSGRSIGRGRRNATGRSRTAVGQWGAGLSMAPRQQERLVAGTGRLGDQLGRLRRAQTSATRWPS